MRVRTTKKHTNSHPPKRDKHPGRIYFVDDAEGRQLIGAGVVEEAPEETDEG